VVGTVEAVELEGGIVFLVVNLVEEIDCLVGPQAALDFFFFFA